jgi:hypothetical protein
MVFTPAGQNSSTLYLHHHHHPFLQASCSVVAATQCSSVVAKRCLRLDCLQTTYSTAGGLQLPEGKSQEPFSQILSYVPVLGKVHAAVHFPPLATGNEGQLQDPASLGGAEGPTVQSAIVKAIYMARKTGSNTRSRHVRGVRKTGISQSGAGRILSMERPNRLLVPAGHIVRQRSHWESRLTDTFKRPLEF